MKETISAIITNHAKEVLVLRRSPAKQWYPGAWDAVCGKIEPGETPEQCLHREVKEEIGVELAGVLHRAGPEAYTVHGEKFIVHLFLCRLDSTAIILNNEHTAYRWVNLQQLLKEEVIPPFRKDLDRLSESFEIFLKKK